MVQKKFVTKELAQTTLIGVSSGTLLEEVITSPFHKDRAFFMKKFSGEIFMFFLI